MFDIRNIAIPIKVTENQYLKSSLKDTVHFGKLMYYTKIEGEGIGDDSEIGYLVNQKKMLLQLL